MYYSCNQKLRGIVHERLAKNFRSEWQLMEVLREKSPLNANAIVEKLANEIDWNPCTIKI